MELNLKIYTHNENHCQKLNLSTDDVSLIEDIIKILKKDCDISHLHNYGLLLRNTQKTRDAFDALFNKYGVLFPNIIRLKECTKHLCEKEEFYLIFADKASDIECKIAIESLKWMKGNVIPEITYNKIFSFYNQQSFDFKFYSFGYDTFPIAVGEKNKDLRVCRFCGAKGREKFKDVAHAIQDSLGNRLLTCFEECDDCNHSLNIIEDNFLHLMDVRRSLYQIRRKSGNTCPTIIGKNYVIKPNASGNPDVYIMKEEISSNTDQSKPFQYTMFHKQTVTNENVLKALSKMVIDLIPEQYLSELQNTIKWIKAIDGSWLVDDLPSYLNAVLPDGLFFKQPELNLFIRKEDDGNTPFCSAILWIYDMAYMFVLPLVDADKGRFKKDESLQLHWKKMTSWYSYLWSKQNTSDWQNAEIWVNWIIDPSDSVYHILPKDNSIFNNCKSQQGNIDEVVFPPIDSNNIEVCKIKTHLKNHYFGPELHNSDLIDLTQKMASPIFYINPKHSRVTVSFSADVFNQNNTELWFEYSVEVTFMLKQFYKNIKIHYAPNRGIDSFSIDINLCYFLFEKMLEKGESQLSLKRAQTNFKSADITKMKAQIERILDKSKYHITIGKQNLVIPNHLVHSRAYI